VSTAVVGDVLEGSGRGAEVALLAVFREGLLGGVQSVNVALVVGIVMPGQYLFGQCRFERVVIVRKRWKFVISHSMHLTFCIGISPVKF